MKGERRKAISCHGSGLRGESNKLSWFRSEGNKAISCHGSGLRETKQVHSFTDDRYHRYTVHSITAVTISGSVSRELMQCIFFFWLADSWCSFCLQNGVLSSDDARPPSYNCNKEKKTVFTQI